jgi:hypothetical protein
MSPPWHQTEVQPRVTSLQDHWTRFLHYSSTVTRLYRVGVVTSFYFIMAAVALHERRVMGSSVMIEPKRKLDKKETGQLCEVNASVPYGR